MGKRIGGETVVGVSRVAIGMEKGARDDRGSGTAITPNQNQLWWQGVARLRLYTLPAKQANTCFVLCAGLCQVEGSPLP